MATGHCHSVISTLGSHKGRMAIVVAKGNYWWGTWAVKGSRFKNAPVAIPSRGGQFGGRRHSTELPFRPPMPNFLEYHLENPYFHRKCLMTIFNYSGHYYFMSTKEINYWVTEIIGYLYRSWSDQKLSLMKSDLRCSALALLNYKYGEVYKGKRSLIEKSRDTILVRLVVFS